MIQSTSTSVQGRVVTAFFDTEVAAQKATDDLVAAGIPSQHITRTGTGGTATDGDHRGFWDSLKDFFLPDEDRHSYAEGLRRGGFLLRVQTEEGNYTRVLDILDTDGAVDMDRRESDWSSEGWRAPPPADDPLLRRDVPAVGLATGTTLSAAANALAMPLDSADATDVMYDHSSDDAMARAAALDTSVPAAAAAARLKRDDVLGRPRVRSYIAEEEAPTTGSFSPTRDAALITDHMEVISSDGQNIGTVDHLDGPDRIKLAKTTSPDGQHHYVPFTWIDHVDQHVHLKKTLAEIKAQQQA